MGFNRPIITPGVGLTHGKSPGHAGAPGDSQDYRCGGARLDLDGVPPGSRQPLSEFPLQDFILVSVSQDPTLYQPRSPDVVPEFPFVAVVDADNDLSLPGI